MKRETPNPAGNKGKPFSLAPHSFDDALRKILSAPPEPKPDKPKKQKAGKSKSKPKSAKELLKSRNKQKGQLQGTAILKSKSNIANN